MSVIQEFLQVLPTWKYLLPEENYTAIGAYFLKD